MKQSSERFNDGLERAALHLQRRADQVRKEKSILAGAIANIFDEQAVEILALRLKE